VVDQEVFQAKLSRQQAKQLKLEQKAAERKQNENIRKMVSIIVLTLALLMSFGFTVFYITKYTPEENQAWFITFCFAWMIDLFIVDLIVIGTVTALLKVVGQSQHAGGNARNWVLSAVGLFIETNPE
jgi:hypothetical protein